MAQTVTGFNAEEINNCISTFETNEKLVMEEVAKQFNNIIVKLSEKWGTKDGYTWVTDELIPGMKKTGDVVKDILHQIPDVIRTTGRKQAEATNNFALIRVAKKTDLGEISNVMKSKLDNGFVGIYDDLQTTVATACSTAKTQVGSKINTLKSQVKAAAEKAFKDSGKAGQVAADIETFAESAKTAVNTALENIETSVAASTLSADTTAHDIQSKGLLEDEAAASAGHTAGQAANAAAANATMM